MADSNENVVARMREDWNARAREDAHYYVAFGRREQDDEEFQETAGESVRSLESELRRLPARPPRTARRALEIGCGPGRLLRPMSAHFGEIHGVDISDEMVGRARRRLAAIPHAHAHVARNSNLEMFADESFDFVYSYAVFQHIPSRDVVLGYLRESWRVLKPGGILRCQLNGLPLDSAAYDTWSGVRIQPGEVEAFCREQGFLLYALEGAGTQYMWTTMRKPFLLDASSRQAEPRPVAVRRITNAQNSEPVAPASGRFAALSLWVDQLPETCDLLSLTVTVGHLAGRLTYIGPREHDGMAQVNLRLPEGLTTGVHEVTLSVGGIRLGPPSKVRTVPEPVLVPRVVAISDGVNLMSGPRIDSGLIKVTMEEVVRPEDFSAGIGGLSVSRIERFCTDPLPPRYEFNLHLPTGLAPGPHLLSLRVGRRELPSIGIEVAAPSGT